jgi:hypothetical protein
MPLDKLIDDVLQRDAVQRIAGMRNRRCHVTIPGPTSSLFIADRDSDVAGIRD